MAADLVESSGISHTFIQDLESFFWVLIWIIITQVKSSWNDDWRTEFLDGTMRPKFYDHSPGKETTMMSPRDRIQSGGRAKKMFLQSAKLVDSEFEIPGNTTLCKLLISLKRAVARRYHNSTNVRSSFDNDFSDDQSEQPISNVNNNQLKDLSKEYFKNHGKMLRQFSKAVKAEWPDNDNAEPQDVLHSRFTTLYG